MKEEKTGQSFYEYLCATDLVHWVKDGLLRAPGWEWDYKDGRLFCRNKPAMSDTPWYHVKTAWWANCTLWHTILFGVVFPKLGVLWVPSKCQNCFKVVVRPKTLKQLFALVEIQKKLDHPSKCGVELRPSTHNNYGGYFYNVGLEEGLKCYEKVRAAVDADKYLGTDVEVLLKRACTEFEHACGDSDKWGVTEYQLQVEAIVDRYIITDSTDLKQPEKLIHNVQRRWIEFAFERGDETYKEFTNGKSLYPKYKTYHHLLTDMKKGNDIAISGVEDSKENNMKPLPKSKPETAESNKQKKAEKAVTKK